jgi:hypothetical protein
MGVYYLCTVNVVQVCHVRILHTYMYVQSYSHTYLEDLRCTRVLQCT